MSENLTFQGITEEYDAIIKSKWKLMEEVDCLPDALTAKIGFTQRMDRYIQRITNRAEVFNSLFLFWKELELFVCDAHGTSLVAKWELEMSTVQPNAVKGIRLITHMRDLPLEDVLALAASERENQDLSSMWLNLPESYQEKEENWVCPQCHKRNLRVGEYSHWESGFSITRFAVTCDSCEYTAKEMDSRYDAKEAFLKRYESELKRFKKKDKFRAKADESLSAIEKSLNDIAALKQNRSVLYDEEDLRNLRGRVDALVDKTFRTLWERLTDKKKKG